MQRLQALTLGVAVWLTYSILPCVAQNNIDSTPAIKTVPVMMEDGTIKQMVVAKKQPFTVRHPKLHKAGRKVRRTCQVLLPVVQFAGSAAQVVRLFY